jgi:transcriptional regulator with XRE-family HTH domain
MKTSVLIGNKIRKVRLEREYSQEYMAQKLNISPATYSKRERGETDMTVSQVEDTAKILEVTVAELLDFGNTQIINLKDSHQNTVGNHEAHVHYDGQLLAHVKEENKHLRVENARLIDIIASKKERKGDPSV